MCSGDSGAGSRLDDPIALAETVFVCLQAQTHFERTLLTFD